MEPSANVSALIETREAPPVSLTPIETLAPSRGATVFRLTCADGSTWKIRRLPSEARAEQMQRLTALAGRDFSQVLARVGDTVLEEWIPGHALPASAGLDAALVERCGAMLGRLHSAAPPGPPPHDGLAAPADATVTPATAVTSAVARIEAHLRETAAFCVLGPPTLRTVRRALEEFRPAQASTGLVHVDFCGENLVETAEGRLVCVDNATLRLAQHDHDLGRTWYRWPLDAAGRRAFLAGYETGRSAADFLAHFPFWALDALLLSIAFRAQLGLAGVQQPVARLEALLAGLARGLAPHELYLH